LIVDLVVHELPLIDTAIWPGELSLTFHVIQLPRAFVGTAIGPLIGTTTFKHVHNEVALIEASVCPSELALARFLTVNILT